MCLSVCLCVRAAFLFHLYSQNNWTDLNEKSHILFKEHFPVSFSSVCKNLVSKTPRRPFCDFSIPRANFFNFTLIHSKIVYDLDFTLNFHVGENSAHFVTMFNPKWRI